MVELEQGKIIKTSAKQGRQGKIIKIFMRQAYTLLGHKYQTYAKSTSEINRSGSPGPFAVLERDGRSLNEQIYSST